MADIHVPASVPPAASDPARSPVLPPRGLVPFLLVAFGWSWGTWWLGPLVVDASDPGALLALVIVGGFGPAIAAVAVTAALEGRVGLGALLRRHDPRRHGGLRPLLLALVVFAALLATVPLAVAAGTPLDADGLAAGLASLPGMILLVALAGGGNEELGWRGYALPRLQHALSPLAASIVLGFTWAVWHAPLWAMAGTSQSRLSFPVYVVLVLAISVVLTHVANASRGGLLPVILTHTAVNTAAGVAASALGGVREVDQTAVLVVIAVAVVVLTRGRLGLPVSSSRPASTSGTPTDTDTSIRQDASHDHR
jgi:membrane protease YdiL (CAAX protease family)